MGRGGVLRVAHFNYISHGSVLEGCCYFAPAEGGALYLENMSAEQIAASKFKVPVTIENWIAPENLSGWSVYVNGTLSRIRWLEKSGDDIYVHQRKALIILVQ